MHEGYTYHAEHSNDKEFEELVGDSKIELLNKLVAHDTDGVDTDNPSFVGITHLEIMALTPTASQDAMSTAILSLKSSGLIRETYYNPYQTAGVFVGYELADDIPTEIVLGGRANRHLDKLEARHHKDGIASLSAEEWALLPILRAARDIAGTHSVDLAEIHRYVLDNLRDEGIDKWHRAFAGAVKQARALSESGHENK